MWSMRESKKLHVTFGDFKRIVNFQDGEKVQDLRHYFLREFSDILSDDIAPANVRFQRYDDTFEDYTDLAKDAKLRENVKLRVLITSKHVTKASGCKDHFAENCHPHFFPHHIIPWYVVNFNQEPSDFKFHPINQNVSYRMWSPVSNGLLQRGSENPPLVNCKGAFDSNNANILIKARFVGMNVFHLVYSEGNGDLFITAKGEGQEIIVQPTPTRESEFEPNYYWGNTVFKSSQYNTLYLGCDENRMATLVPMEDPHYPNPQSFFIVNKYNPILPHCK